MILRCRKSINSKDIPDTISSTYSQIAYAAFGINGSRVVDTCIAITLLGVCTTYLIAASQMMQSLPYISLSTNVWILLVALIVFPISSMRDIGKFAHVSFWGIILLLLSILTVVVFGMSTYYQDRREFNGEYPLNPMGFVGIMNYIGIGTFCYGQCSIIFQVEQSMQDKSQITSALVYCLVFVWMIYAFVGDFVAVLYIGATNGLQSNILLNLPTHSLVSQLVSLLMAGVCVLSYPLTIFPAATMVSSFSPLYVHFVLKFSSLSLILLSLSSSFHIYLWQIEKWLVSMYPALSSSQDVAEYLPLTVFSMTNGTSYSREEDRKSAPIASSSSSSSSHAEEQAMATTLELYEPHALARYICRFTLVMITALLAASIPCFALLINILGSGTVSILTYVLPPLLHLVLVTSKTLEPAVVVDYDNSERITIMEFSKTDYFSPMQQLWVDRCLFVLGLTFAIIATGVTFVSVYDQLTSPTPQC